MINYLLAKERKLLRQTIRDEIFEDVRHELSDQAWREVWPLWDGEGCPCIMSGYRSC